MSVAVLTLMATGSTAFHSSGFGRLQPHPASTHFFVMSADTRPVVHHSDSHFLHSCSSWAMLTRFPSMRMQRLHLCMSGKGGISRPGRRPGDAVSPSTRIKVKCCSLSAFCASSCRSRDSHAMIEIYELHCVKPRNFVRHDEGGCIRVALNAFHFFSTPVV